MRDWVIELYDDQIGILTNAPTFDWHMTNLRNYLMGRADNPQPVAAAGTVLAPPGQASGFLGIPGDWTPPSRFVRTAARRLFASKTDTATDTVNLVAHILNAVDIPKGTVRDTVGNQNFSDYTQWVVIEDLSNRKLYFRSYDNLSMRMIDIKRLNLAPGAEVRYLPIAGGDAVQDVTSSIK
jgi:choloylglycine hydrolase